MKKERKITAPEGCEIEKVELIDGVAVVTFREKKRKPPKSWEEFCEMYPIKKGEAFIDKDDQIQEFEHNFVEGRSIYDTTILPDYATAKAVLALFQLIQLRNAYNGNWVPDWKDLTEQKFVIKFTALADDFVTKKIKYQHASLLYFKSKELRDEFLRNFRQLIEKLKPLYGIKERGKK